MRAKQSLAVMWFASPATRDAMLRGSTQSGGAYGLGIARLVLPEGELLGHHGFYGVVAFHWPAKDAFIVATLNQTQADTDAFLAEVMRILQRAPSAGRLDGALSRR